MGIEGQDNLHAIGATGRPGIAALNFLGIHQDFMTPLEKTISMLVFEICLTSVIRTIGPFSLCGADKVPRNGAVGA
jgi:hypothetical protein